MAITTFHAVEYDPNVDPENLIQYESKVYKVKKMYWIPDNMALKRAVVIPIVSAIAIAITIAIMIAIKIIVI